MKYYTVTHSTNEKEVGAFPQTEGFPQEYDYSKSESVRNMPPYSIPNFQPDLDNILINKNSKVTDCITSPITASGILVSKNAKDVFEKHKLCKHKLFPASLRFKGRTIDDYYWLSIGEYIEQFDLIDYEKTKFCLKARFNWEEDEQIAPPPNSNTDLISMADIQVNEAGQPVHPIKKLFFKTQSYDFKLDLFYFYFNDTIVISERLKDALIGLTGFSITEVDFEIR